MLQAGVSTVVGFGSKAHGSTIAATSSGFLVVSSGSVPGKSNKNLDRADQFVYFI
jgi:hypothetical protein